VVHITTLATRQDAFSFDIQQIPQGTGSGFVWDEDGHVVTNYHVIQDADAATVTLAGHSSWKAKLVGAYPDKDLAVLLVDAPRDQLHPISLGSSQDLQVGQKVFAIGNPFWFGPIADDRDHQRSGTRDRVGHAASDQGRDPKPMRQSTPGIPAGRCWTAPGG